MAGIAIAFNGVSLQTDRIWTIDTDIYSSPETSVQVDSLAQADAGVFVRKSLKPKSFSVSGLIRGTSWSDTESLMDELKVLFRGYQQNLDIQYANSTRRYLVTPQNVIIGRSGRRMSASWSVQFICASGVGTDTDPTTLLAPTTITTSTASIPITVGGTYQAEPSIRMTLTSVSSGTAKTMTITNNSTLRGIAITRNWSAGDIVDIDSLGKTVYVNSQVVQFNGQFPKWDIGSQSIGYLDDFGSRAVTMQGTYTRRWL